MVKVVFYGRLADVFGRELELGIPQPCSIAELRQIVAWNYPNGAEALRGHRVRACIGDSLVAEEHMIAACDEVEFLPPVSGG